MHSLMPLLQGQQNISHVITIENENPHTCSCLKVTVTNYALFRHNNKPTEFFKYRAIRILLWCNTSRCDKTSNILAAIKRKNF